MKLAEMVVSAILKKGIMWEGRNVDITVGVPGNEDVKIQIKADHMQITMIKEQVEEA